MLVLEWMRVSGRGHSCAKVLGQDWTWRVGGTRRRPVRLEQSEQRGEGGGRAGRGQADGAVCGGLWEDFGFDPE